MPTGLQLFFPEKAFNANSLKGSGGVFNSVNLNVYHYADLNPVKYVDPDGKTPALAIETAIGGAELGSTLGPIGTVVGGAIGLGVGLYVSYKVGQALENMAVKAASKENTDTKPETKAKEKSPNQMQQEVKTGKAPKGVDRVDKGNANTGEKDHVHLDDGRALNKDGTWKHNKTGDNSMGNKIKEWIKDSGWKLPIIFIYWIGIVRKDVSKRI